MVGTIGSGMLWPRASPEATTRSGAGQGLGVVGRALPDGHADPLVQGQRAGPRVGPQGTRAPALAVEAEERLAEQGPGDAPVPVLPVYGDAVDVPPGPVPVQGQHRADQPVAVEGQR